MFKSKGLIVHWPDVAEGETAPMQFGHEVGKQAANMRRSFNTNFRGTYNRVCKITSKKHRWIIRIVTALDYTNPKTGAVTTELIKSIITPTSKCTLNDLAIEIEKVQREDMTTPVKKFAGRTIECFCKD
jgi:hypothetical protein